MISTNEGYTRLEYFSEDVAADKNRKEFDIKNHTLCYTNQRPDFLFVCERMLLFPRNDLSEAKNFSDTSRLL